MIPIFELSELCGEMKSTHSVQCAFVLLHSIELRRHVRAGYWQDSQPGSSMLQKRMSVATVSGAVWEACADAVASADTAFIVLSFTVDFSTWVADRVRK